MMKSMEEEIDIPLITRTNKGISLTPDGKSAAPNQTADQLQRKS